MQAKRRTCCALPEKLDLEDLKCSDTVAHVRYDRLGPLFLSQRLPLMESLADILRSRIRGPDVEQIFNEVERHELNTQPRRSGEILWKSMPLRAVIGCQHMGMGIIHSVMNKEWT